MIVAFLIVEYGYAATGHSAQGLGADRVLLDKDASAKTTDHRSFYTDLTRTRDVAVIYTNDRRALPEAIARRSEKMAALDVAEPQRQLDQERLVAHGNDKRGPSLAQSSAPEMGRG